MSRDLKILKDGIVARYKYFNAGISRLQYAGFGGSSEEIHVLFYSVRLAK
jgi:hypothetical protein